jgi:S-adenosylmethionine uptake transporter
VIAAVGAIGVLSGLDATVKALTADYPVPQVVAVRFAVGVVAALLWALATRTPMPTRLGFRRAAVRAIAILGTAGLFFTALTRLPLAEAVVITFVSPFLMVLVSRVLLGEPVTARATAAIAVGFGGVVLMMAGNVSAGVGGDPLGYAAALAACLTYAVAIVLTRRDSGSEPVVSLVLTQNIVVTLAALPFGLSVWVPPDRSGALLFLLAGVLGTIGHIVLAWAYARAPATRLAPLEYTAFLWAAALGWMLWGEVPTLATMIGGALIIAAALTASTGSRPVVGP